MKKQHLIRVIFVVFSIFMGTWLPCLSTEVLGACPDIVGDWKFTISSAYYDPTLNPPYGYETHKGIFHIDNQKNCFFYGTREVPGNPIIPLTGVILTDKSPIEIKMDAGDRIYFGTLGGYDNVQGLFTKINYFRLNLRVNESDNQKAGKGLAIRQ